MVQCEAHKHIHSCALTNSEAERNGSTYGSKRVPLGHKNKQNRRADKGDGRLNTDDVASTSTQNGTSVAHVVGPREQQPEHRRQ